MRSDLYFTAPETDIALYSPIYRRSFFLQTPVASPHHTAHDPDQRVACHAGVPHKRARGGLRLSTVVHTKRFEESDKA